MAAETSQDRAKYARYMEACETGQFHIGDGHSVARTAAHAEHLRRIVSELDTVIADMERDHA